MRTGSLRPRRDLRAPTLGLVAWVTALATSWWPAWVVLAGLTGWALVMLLVRRTAGQVAWLLAALAVAASVWLHVEAVVRSPVAQLAAEQAVVSVQLTVRSDPVAKKGRFSSYVMFRAQVSELVGRGSRHRLRAPVLVLADPDWRTVRMDQRLRAWGRLSIANGSDLAGVLSARGPPVVLAESRGPFSMAEGVRAGIRRASGHLPRGARELVPALVDGDKQGLPDDVVSDFSISGLTHLLAVSGTNLTLVVGFLLILARWAGVRARALMAVGVLGVVGFVLLSRAEPSVLRAAAMGSVALVGMGSGGRDRGPRALGVAVLVLLLFDPWLATSMGFALSACATAGILLLAPGWRDALMRWLPRWAAEALAVPMAAQLACTPLVAAIAGRVSLVAVVANVLAAPAVGPATVLGLVGGLVGLVWNGLGQAAVAPAGWCAWWIIEVAHRSASLPVAAVGWSSTTAAVVALAVLCAGVALTLASVLARRGLSLLLAVLLVVAVLVPLPTPGWPPKGWVFVACDVGQGDGLVLNGGGGQYVVVDSGPDPALIDTCLRTLDVRRIALVVLTHFHADHVDGLPAVLGGRAVSLVEVSSLADPLDGSRLVRGAVGRAGVPLETARLGETRIVGTLSIQVLGPSGPTPPGSDSPPNDESIVLYVQTRGIELLLMGDEETPSQKRLAALVPGLHADVLKVAHHGSAKQDPALVSSLGARLAVISDGVDNAYGHPAPSTLDLLRQAGMLVRRTDLDGDVAVVVDDHGVLRVRTRMPRQQPRPGR